MEWPHLLDAVQNDRIAFVTMRPPGSPFTTLDRRVVLTGPPEAQDLAATGDPRVLEALIALLRDPARAWAAEVVLAALTRREEKQVDSFAAAPDTWWAAVGP